MMKENLDPKILGQLLLMQSIVINLPDSKSIFSFVCKGLLDIPGVRKIEFLECNDKKSEVHDINVDFPVNIEKYLFGNITVELSDPEKFKPYEDYVKNFVFMIAIILDERKQRQLNEEHKEFLEKKIDERTQEFKNLNDEYLSLNEELTENIEVLRKTNNQLELAKKKAEESDKLKTAFLQNMSHEIRTPMNAIMGFSELLSKNFDNKQKLELYSKIINNRCNDLLDIINDILDIAKIESGQLTINYEPCNVNKLFYELTDFFKEHQKRIGKEHIILTLKSGIDSAFNSIITDKVKLKQILINLINNALKFTESGSISVGCFQQKDNLKFYISDTGVGIPENEQKAVFERFYQLKNKTMGGTGLGLPIVKGLVNLLGGEVTLESEPNKGSTFSFTIPIKSDDNKPEDQVDSKQPEKLVFPDKTILVVEDDVFNAEYIKEILTSHGIKFIHVASGKDAVEMALHQPVDLILMDIRLPDIDGYEASRLIKKEKHDIIIIAQTAYASNDDKQKALDMGCNDYLSKPTKEELLLSTVYKHLV